MAIETKERREAGHSVAAWAESAGAAGHSGLLRLKAPEWPATPALLAIPALRMLNAPEWLAIPVLRP